MPRLSMTESAAHGLALVGYTGCLLGPVVSWSGSLQLGASVSFISLFLVVIAYILAGEHKNEQ